MLALGSAAVVTRLIIGAIYCSQDVIWGPKGVFAPLILRICCKIHDLSAFGGIYEIWIWNICNIQKLTSRSSFASTPWKKWNDRPGCTLYDIVLNIILSTLKLHIELWPVCVILANAVQNPRLLLGHESCARSMVHSTLDFNTFTPSGEFRVI